MFDTVQPVRGATILSGTSTRRVAALLQSRIAQLSAHLLKESEQGLSLSLLLVGKRLFFLLLPFLISLLALPRFLDLVRQTQLQQEMKQYTSQETSSVQSPMQMLQDSLRLEHQHLWSSTDAQYLELIFRLYRSLPKIALSPQLTRRWFVIQPKELVLHCVGLLVLATFLVPSSLEDRQATLLLL
jgi:hypothetical protein